MTSLSLFFFSVIVLACSVVFPSPHHSLLMLCLPAAVSSTKTLQPKYLHRMNWSHCSLSWFWGIQRFIYLLSQLGGWYRKCLAHFSLSLPRAPSPPFPPVCHPISSPVLHPPPPRQRHLNLSSLPALTLLTLSALFAHTFLRCLRDFPQSLPSPHAASRWLLKEESSAASCSQHLQLTQIRISTYALTPPSYPVVKIWCVCVCLFLCVTSLPGAWNPGPLEN